jgi:hypothetical protein
MFVALENGNLMQQNIPHSELLLIPSKKILVTSQQKRLSEVLCNSYFSIHMWVKISYSTLKISSTMSNQESFDEHSK